MPTAPKDTLAGYEGLGSRPADVPGERVSDVLARAADLIEPKGAWTQHDFAKDKNGEPTGYDAPDAVCWCARGAIAVVSGATTFHDVERVWINAGGYLGFDDYTEIESWNDADHCTQAVVVAALRRAAAKAASFGR